MLRRNFRVAGFDVTPHDKDSTNVAVTDSYFVLSNRLKLRRRLLFGFFAVAAVILLHTCVFDRATWYGEHWRGKKMANGKPYNPDAFTCASWDYPLGSKLRLTYEKSSVTVHVTDRGGKNRWYQFGKTIDLTPTAFAKLAPLKTGSIPISVHRID